MEENKTKELINVFSNTYELIRQAAHILDHESMTKCVSMMRIFKIVF